MERNQSRLKNVWDSAVEGGSRFIDELAARIPRATAEIKKAFEHNVVATLPFQDSKPRRLHRQNTLPPDRDPHYFHDHGGPFFL